MILGALPLGSRLAIKYYLIVQAVQENYLVNISNNSQDRYRFGFNGQEKVNEIAGIGNHYTAEFWEYDTRLARRWNLDPVTKEFESPYSVLNDNPIYKNDINGDDPVNINVTSTLEANDALKVKAERYTGKTTNETTDSKGNRIVTTKIYSDVITARISSDPTVKSISSNVVESIETTIVQKFDYEGIPQLPKVSTKNLGSKTDNELVTSLDKGVKFLESFRNKNGRQYNRAIIEESKSFNNALKGAEAPFIAAKSVIKTSHIVAFGTGDVSIKKAADYYLQQLLEKNAIAIPRSVYEGPRHIGPGIYRNEPSDKVKDWQQKIFNVIFSWWLY